MKKLFFLILWGLVTLCMMACRDPLRSADQSFSDPSKQYAAAENTQTAAENIQTNTDHPTITFTDDLGREISLSRPKRVITTIGSFADIWCIAGGRDTLVGTGADAWTSFSLDLPDTTANIGTVKEPNLELILAAEPDLVIASTNTASNLELEDILTQAGIPAAYFDVSAFDDYLRILHICTQLTGQPERYTTYGTDIQAQVDAAIASQTDSAPTVLYVRASGSSCKVKNSEGSVLGEMLADLGCTNIADSHSGLLENLTLEAIIAGDPDYIFATLQGADKSVAEQMLHKTLLSNPAWSGLRAVQEGHFYVMDPSLYNLKPNARWGDAYETLANLLYGTGEE